MLRVIAANTSIKANARIPTIVARIMTGHCIQEEKVKRAKEKEKTTGKGRAQTLNAPTVVGKATSHQNVDLRPRNQGPQIDLHPRIPNQKEKEREKKGKEVDPDPETQMEQEKEKKEKERVRSARYVAETITSLPSVGIGRQYAKDITRRTVRSQTARNSTQKRAGTGNKEPAKKQIACFCTEPLSGPNPNLQLLHLSRKRDLTHQHLRKPSKRPTKQLKKQRKGRQQR